MLEEIYQLAAAFLGESGEDAALRASCKAAEAMLAAQLRGGVSPEDCRESFVCAAAWNALAGYRAADAGEDFQSFSMADVSVSRGSGDAAATALRRQAEILMAPWCQGGFAFRGVRS